MTDDPFSLSSLEGSLDIDLGWTYVHTLIDFDDLNGFLDLAAQYQTIEIISHCPLPERSRRININDLTFHVIFKISRAEFDYWRDWDDDNFDKNRKS